ncbi:MAG: endonuclease/exonuclease/phosphatase family protein [Archangium sp.]
MKLTLATWNVHEFVGADARRDDARIAEVVKSFDADIVALQEVPLSRDETPPQSLLHMPELHTVVAAHERWDGVWLGNVILSKLPMKSKRRVNLDFRTHEPRSFIEGIFETGSVPLRVIATHLGLRPAERRFQVKRILESVSDDETSVTVLLGDFNEWFLVGRPLRWLHARFGKAHALRTFPARLPVLALDRVWVHPPGRLKTIGTRSSELIKQASDHLPVVATLEV